MSARARLATEHLPETGRTVVSELCSQAPLLLRLTLPKGPEPWTAGSPDVARVCVAAGAAGPVGGDRLELDVEVGAGSTLVLSDVSPTLLLPGPGGERSTTRTRITVGPGGTLVWTPEPVIAAAGSHHLNDIGIDLAEGARLLMRDELVLGRHAEAPGTVHQRVRVRYGGRPLHHQDLGLGDRVPEWRSPAVAHGLPAVGSVLVVDPARHHGDPCADAMTGTTAVLPLSGPGVLISGLAPDALALRRALDAALCGLVSSKPSPEPGLSPEGAVPRGRWGGAEPASVLGP